MRVANPRLVISRARIIGLVARWVMLLPEVAQDALDLVLGVELVVLYRPPVGRLDLRFLDTRPAPLLVQLDAHRSVRQPPVRHDLAVLEAEEVPARAPQVRRRQGDDHHQDRRQAPHELSETIALPASRLRTAAPGALSFRRLSRGWAPGRRAPVPESTNGRHLAGATGALLPRNLFLHVHDYNGHVVHAAGVQGRGEQVPGRGLGV